ncbi:MAG TPA: histidine phosphatase family protein [Opitutaceae bacterium]|nr:histidine phosphatase family protein [Opitutaceae bacterium]
MILHLIRHAHAVAASEDPRRPLSRRGRAQVAQVAAFFRANGQLQPAEIWHSPLARSRETATRLAAALGFSGPLKEKAGLEPEDDPAATAARLGRLRHRVAVVGHEPHLGTVAALLVTGSGDTPAFGLKKACCLALERSRGRWRVRWLAGPELLGARDD